MVLVFVLVFGLLAFLKTISPKRLSALSVCVFSRKYFSTYSNELTESNGLFYRGFFLIQLLLGALLLFLVAERQALSFFQDSFFFYSQVICGLGLYFFFQDLSGRALAHLFRWTDAYQAYRTSKNSYLKSVLLLCSPALLFLVYGFPESLFFYQATLFSAIFLFAMRWGSTLKYIYKKLPSGSIFYFILYLCALEIAPLLIFIKTVIE